MTWILQLTNDASTEQDIYIDRDMLVGRHQDADIRLQSAEISRRHAAFLFKEQALWLQDLNSSNGTFVNAVRIAEETQVVDGDEIAFAQLKFKLSFKPIESAPELSNTQEAAESTPVDTPAETPSPAAQMNEQGMPSVSERAAGTKVDQNGMPEHVAVPKPAPIPAGVDLKAAAEQQPIAVPAPESVVEKAAEERKNTSVGLMTVIVLVILAVIAWLMFK